MKEEIELRVSIDETNLILEALGNLPFSRVYNLIAKIHSHARAQLDHDQPVPLALDRETGKTGDKVIADGETGNGG